MTNNDNWGTTFPTQGTMSVDIPWQAPAPVPQTQWPITANQPLIKAASTNPYDAMSQDEVLMKWQELKQAVETAKAAEMEMRKYIVARAFPSAKEGTNTLDLGQGYQLKAGVKFNYTLDPDLDKVEAALDKIAEVGNIGPFLTDRLVKWSASFLLTEYRNLEKPDASPDEKKVKAIIDTVLTITPAAPTLEIKEPKKPKK